MSGCAIRPRSVRLSRPGSLRPGKKQSVAGVASLDAKATGPEWGYSAPGGREEQLLL